MVALHVMEVVRPPTIAVNVHLPKGQNLQCEPISAGKNLQMLRVGPGTRGMSHTAVFCIVRVVKIGEYPEIGLPLLHELQADLSVGLPQNVLKTSKKTVSISRLLYLAESERAMLHYGRSTREESSQSGLGPRISGFAYSTIVKYAKPTKLACDRISYGTSALCAFSFHFAR